MLNSDYPVLGAFHDGIITAVHGTVPGDIRLVIHCDYLRRMFPDPGLAFVVELQKCTYVSYESGTTGEIRAGFQPAMAPEASILAVLYDKGQHDVYMGEGVLSVRYESGLIFLDNGREVFPGEMESAIHQYWDEWGRKGQTDQGPGDARFYPR